MNDEEMAEKYAKANTHYEIAKRENGADYAKEVSSVTIKQAYLAGLKAGRETEREYVENNAFTSMKEQGLFPFGKWHKVADGDLPKNRRNIYVAYLNGYNEIVTTIASFRHKFWVFDGHKTECEVIAWCELPKYIEE